VSESPLPSPPPHPTGWRDLANRAGMAIMRASLHVSPWPMAHLLRRRFTAHGGQLGARLSRQAPVDIVTVVDEPYDLRPDSFLDVYVPAVAAAVGQRLPTIVWTHGGAFVGGSKEELAGYFRMIAETGFFTVVGVRYSLAPQQSYPTPVRQVMAALAYLQTNADRLHVDPNRLVLAGDSAGAHISAQLAAAITNPVYATLLGVPATIYPRQLRAVALCCGIYDLATADPREPLRDFFTTVGWAYSGTRDFRSNGYFTSTWAVADHATEAFPPSFITAGNADPLAPQSAALAATLVARGVDVDTLFYPPDHAVALPHEYQFDVEQPDARAALQRLITFCQRWTRHDHHSHHSHPGHRAGSASARVAQ
jgi:acetyl esterase/lipase